MAGTIERDEVRTGARDTLPDRPENAGPSSSALLFVAALTTGVVAQGAYYPNGQQVMAALVVAALVTGLRTRRWSAADARLAPVRAAGALAAWALISATLSGRPAAATSTAAMLAGLVAVLLVCRRLTLIQRDTLLGAAVAIGVLVSATGWVGVAWRLTPWALEDGGLWRAASVLTYANATAGLLVPLSMVAIARLTRNPRSPVSAACACLLLVGVGATLSRAGLLALVVGLAVLLVFLGVRRVVSTLAAPVVGAAVALLGLAPSMPIESPARPAVALIALCAGLATAVGLARVTRRRMAFAVPVIAVVALLPIFGVDTAGTLSAIGAPRASLASPDRTDEMRTALQVATGNPVAGVGPGQAVLMWTTADGDVKQARYAHNEYLQMAAELGFVGLALVVALLATLGRAVWRGRGRVPAAPELFAGAAAGLAALAVHSAFDFLWHVPVIPLVGGLLVGIQLHQEKEHSHEH